MAQFRNVPADVVGQRIVPHMNVRTAARFALVSKQYSADARRRVKVTTNARRGGIQARVDAAARPLAGMLLLALKYVQTDQWMNDNLFLHGLGKRVSKIVPFLGQVIVIIHPKKLTVWTAGLIAAEIKVRKARRHFVLDTPSVAFAVMMSLTRHAPLATSRQWFLKSVLARATRMYNERPLAVRAS